MYEWLFPILGHEIYMMSLEHLCVVQSTARKLSNPVSMMLKELRSHYEESPSGQRWDNLSFSKGKKYNGLKQKIDNKCSKMAAQKAPEFPSSNG